MARTVSRVADNGKSEPVPVVDLGGTIEDHRPDPSDFSTRVINDYNPSNPLDRGLESKIPEWVENLMSSATVFSSTKGSFKLAAAGLHGSIQPISKEIRQDPYVMRAVQRGRIDFLTEQEATEKMFDLKDEHETSESHLDHLRDSLNAGASENNGLYKKPLLDEGEPNGPSMSWEEVWEQSSSTPKAKPRSEDNPGLKESQKRKK